MTMPNCSANAAKYSFSLASKCSSRSLCIVVIIPDRTLSPLACFLEICYTLPRGTTRYPSLEPIASAEVSFSLSPSSPDTSPNKKAESQMSQVPNVRSITKSQAFSYRKQTHEESRVSNVPFITTSQALFFRIQDC